MDSAFIFIKFALSAHYTFMVIESRDLHGCFTTVLLIDDVHVFII